MIFAWLRPGLEGRNTLNYFVFCCICFLIFSPPLFSQSRNQFSGVIRETYSKVTLPFVHITVNDSVHALSDMDGRFEIKIKSPVRKVTLKYNMHRSVTLGKNISDTLLITMDRNELFLNEENSFSDADRIMLLAISMKKSNDQKKFKNYSYRAYNKFTLDAGKNEKANVLLNTLSKTLPFHFDTLHSDQHLMMMESVSEKKYMDELHQKETIEGVHSSDITFPSLFIQTSQLHASSIYENYFRIGGDEYMSPLINKASMHYAFRIVDRMYLDNDSIYVIKFNPLPKRKFPAMKGYLYIDRKNYAIKYLIVSPAQTMGNEINFSQSYKTHAGNINFTERTRVQIISRSGLAETKFIASGNTYIQNLQLNDMSLEKKKFNETVLEYLPIAEHKSSVFWNAKRPMPLTHTDSATYSYYTSWDKNKMLQKFLLLGERIAYGVIPIGILNFDLDRVVNLNYVEGLRLGIGIHTNQRLSQSFSVGGYFGYGTKDKKIKYGGDFSYSLLDNIKLWHKISFSHDIAEAGGVNFSFDRHQYPTEGLRNLRLTIMDRIYQFDNSLTSHPLKYLDILAGINISVNTPTYTYSYKENAGSYNFTEIRSGIRYAFGEQLIYFPSGEKSLGSKYPIIYFQITKGLHFLFGKYNYEKFDFKMEQSIRIPKAGISTFQLIGGLATGDLVYSRLYNMKGSFHNPSVVIHNSFETMRYNEFLSDRYFALFFSHNVGRIYINHPHIKPTLKVLHNMGIGSLAHPEYQTLLPFMPKTMNKGYVESGIFVDNIYVLNLAGLKTGIGAGFFYRYGAYASLKGSENIVFKFSLNFGL